MVEMSHHLQLASAGARAEAVAAAVPEVEGKYSATARRRVRSALVDDGVADQLEILVTGIASSGMIRCQGSSRYRTG